MTWKLNPWIIAAVAGLLLLAGAGYYVQHLRAVGAELRQERNYQKQRAAAAEDSLKKIRSYESASGTLRELYERALSPSRNPDTLGREGATSRTEATLDPKPADTADTAEPARTREDGTWVYVLDQQVGLYDLDGRLNVYPPGDRIAYDVTIDARPFKVQFYRTKANGVRQLRVDLPGTVRPVRAAGYYGATKPPPAKENPWDVHLPLAATRLGLAGNYGIGGRVQRSLDLPLGLKATGSVGMLFSPAALQGEDGRAVSPEVELYVGF
jgi:hypothetical protein